MNVSKADLSTVFLSVYRTFMVAAMLVLPSSGNTPQLTSPPLPFASNMANTAPPPLYCPLDHRRVPSTSRDGLHAPPRPQQPPTTATNGILALHHFPGEKRSNHHHYSQPLNTTTITTISTNNSKPSSTSPPLKTSLAPLPSPPPSPVHLPPPPPPPLSPPVMARWNYDKLGCCREFT